MRHVSDGELHAFLDGGLDLLPEGRGGEVREHISSCPVCQERLQDEEVLRSQATEVLGEPSLGEVPLPTFEELRALAEARGEGEGARGDVEARSHHRGPLTGIPLAWAATIVLALGVGWMGGQVLSTHPSRQVVRPGLDESEVPAQSEAGFSNLAVDPSTAGQGRGSRGGAQGEAPAPEGVVAPAVAEGAQPSRERQEVAQEPTVGALHGEAETLAREEERRADPIVSTPTDSGPDPAEARMAAEAVILQDRKTAEETPVQALASAARIAPDPEAEGLSLSFPLTEDRDPDSMSLDSLESSLAVPGLKVVSIGWETRVPGEKSLLIRQLLVSPGDTMELRYFGMLLGADPLPKALAEGRIRIGEPTGGRLQTAVLEASLPAGWSQVAMEWGRGLLVARAPLPESNLKALLKTIH